MGSGIQAPRWLRGRTLLLVVVVLLFFFSYVVEEVEGAVAAAGLVAFRDGLAYAHTHG